MAKTDYVSFFKGKTATLMGLGLLGRGSGDAAFLAQHCARVLVTDMKGAEALRPSIEALSAYKNIEFHLGGHSDALFTQTDFVIKGAGVRLDNRYIALARQHNVPVYMSTALFAHLSGIKTIGVTGTRGKTTVTCMIADILEKAGRKVLLGGNIRGVSTLAQLPQADQYEAAVLELDSWQLQGFDDLHISPNLSVFTSFYPDHMNYYDGNEAHYLNDKTAIYRNQKPGDVLITTPEVNAILPPHRTDGWVVAPPLPDTYILSLPGAHNRMNAALARETMLRYGVDAAVIDAALPGFSGVEGRLSRAGTWQGRSFYNDSNATTQEATLAALNAFPANKIVLIFGGADKGLPIDALIHKIGHDKIRAVLLKGTGSDRVLQHLPGLPVAGSMAEAVQRACALSASGDTLILSPAFASFGMFTNEYDRSDQFVAEVNRLMAAGKEFL
ncbi:MAG: hypothetical protein JO126_00340 [Alphaproteobacteria bacterium]|nr:hypothetical protein [Alphaproteobacteria bacterium]